MASFVANNQAVIFELTSLTNGDMHINHLDDYMTPYGLLVPMNLNSGVLRMVQDAKDWKELQDVEFNQRYRTEKSRTSAEVYAYFDWNARLYLVFVYHNKTVFQKVQQHAAPFYYTNNIEPMEITAVNETYTAVTTLQEAIKQMSEISGEPFGHTFTVVYSEWIKQKPEGAINLPVFPAIVNNEESKS